MRSSILWLGARARRLLLAPLLSAVASFVLCAGAWAAPPTLIAQPGVTAPASIAELARALKYDVNLIYEYVYTNIEYSPTFGLKKGALGTLLDGVGNDFDQSALLVALLRQSGYTASYQYGQIRLFPADIAAFYGVDISDGCPILNLLVAGGIPVTMTYVGPAACTSPIQYADIAHVWVSVTGGSLGGTTAVLDPSYKTYASATGINLATATGYSQSTFLTAAKSGASFTPGFSIQNVNGSNIASLLTGYANNLVANIRATNPTATPRDVLGGKYIQPLAQPYTLPSSQPLQTPGTTPTIWTGDVDNAYRTTMQIQIGGINKTYYGDAIYGHRLSIVYNSSVQPVLYLDGIAQGTGSASANTITYNVTFPICFGAGGGASVPPCTAPGSTNVFTFQNVIQAVNTYTYAIVAGWDVTGRGMADFHRRQLEINKAAGNADSSEPVLGETLNIVGYSWQAQLAAAAAITDRIVGSKTVFHCLIGIVGQVTGPYVDMPGGFAGVSSLDNDLNKANTAFFSVGGALSAFEWGVLDQNLAKTSVNAVSTIKLLDLANSQNLITYDATAANWGIIRPLIAPYYFASDLAQINALISLGYRVILPGRGNLTQGAWTGAGYIGIGTGVLTYKISSFIKGGYTTGAVPSSSLVPNVAATTPNVAPQTQVSSLDPIDLSSGAFLYDHDDLSLGSAGFPVGLGFRRSYRSNNAYAKGPLGPGWTHGLAISASSNSDGLKGMAQDSPIDGAAAIAATYVVQNLFSDPAKPFDKVMIASLVQKWLMDRLISNTVNVTTGSQAEQFVLLVDGTYNPQLGSSSRLSLDSGAYTLQTKDSTALAFNAAGNISNWRSPANGTVSFAYDASTPPLLTSVSNGFGRSLTLNYNGSKQLTSVNDNSLPARSVGYTYDGSGNLASFSDPLTNFTTFAYAAPGLLSQVSYPANPGSPFVSNTYDSLGRVATQTSANGATWSYYFAGYRSEEDDPYGTQHVLYFNPRGKAQFDIQDAAGLNLVSTFLYDGLDRLSSTTLPEGGSTSYTYATAVNPWANNLASVVRNPKPGSPLAALTTSYTYDPVFNKPTSVTDPRGLVTTATYDPSSGNLLSATADSVTLKATTRYTYDAVGLPVTATNPLGIVTQFAYDGSGNRTSTIADTGPGRLNQTTNIAYDSRGDPVSVTDPRGNITTVTYDDARRPITTTSPATPAAPSGLVTTTVYDPDSRPTQVQQSAGGSVLRTVGATYTVSGKTATTTDANGNVTRYAYDLLDRLATATDAMARVTQFTYTTLGQPYRAFNPGISTVNPLLTQTWTTDGQLATLADANGNATAFAYDGFDRLATATYPGSTTEAYTYDADSNVLTRKTRAGGTPIAFAYDTLNRLITKTPPSGPVVSYTYDLAGGLKSASDNSAAIPSAVPPTGSPVAYTTNFTYDAMNRPTGVTWDPAPTATAPGVASSVTFGHSYNKVNQRIGQAVSDNSWINYPAATLATTPYVPNALSQYASVGGVAQTYDTNGNLTSDGTYTYGYDPESRLVSASGAGTSGAYTFDAQGSRKTVTTGGSTTVFVTDADNREVLEYDGSSGAIQRWYAYGLGPNDVLNQMNVPAATRTTFVPDLLGSVVATMASSTGTLSRFGYRPYGANAAAPTPFGFTGQRIDVEAGGLYYFRARAYSPKLGRFLQTDPIGYDGGINLYAYVGNDPLNLIDPEGLSALAAIAGFGSDLYQSVLEKPVDDVSRALNRFRADPGEELLTAMRSIPQTRATVVVAGAATATAWGRAETLTRHFIDHGADFGARNTAEYANMASRFLRESQVAKLPTKIDSQGMIRVFDPKTRTFGAFNPDGTTRTFFKSTSPTYFDRQPGRLVP